MRIVVAEDSDIARTALVQILTSLGHAVVSACSNANDAIAACSLHRPDVAILDISIPPYDNAFHIEEILRAGTASRLVIASSFVGGHHDSGLDAWRERGVLTMQKPFREQPLRDLLARV